MAHEHDRTPAPAHGVRPGLLRSLDWRLIGPYRGGRVGAVAGDWANPRVFYFGSTGGGVWKTTDGGLFWENVSDGFFERASVGAIAVSASDPNVLYVGMGESCIRGNVSHGDGVYKSTDGGKSWTHLGLADTRHIAKLRVHPRDPDRVYVAALGHAHGPNRQRGVFRSRDGGQTWEHVLFRSERAGASDLCLDPHNPRVLYATCWEAERTFWSLTSGGPGSAIFKSTDGGDSWSELTRNKGLPRGVLGKIGIAASGAREGLVWAIVEAEDGAVFRSEDGGMSWERLCEERGLRQRAWYYHHIFADPREPQTVWVLNVEAWKSTDGGRTFAQVPIPHGDNHDLWIDPRDPQRMIEGNDGGACVSFNGGESWSSLYNQPTAEFYHVTTDAQVPYHVYGAQQDNTTLSLPSRSARVAIGSSEYREIGGGESGYVAVRPDDPSIVYAGSYLGYLTRYDQRTGQARTIDVWPEPTLGWGAKDARYRFQWTYPIALSPHDPNTLYVTGNHVFRSTDEGSSWEPISPDLTRNDRSKLEPSGGPITKDNTGAEYYATIFAFAESPLERGLLWAGSDDGLVHLSRDGGASWANVTPAGLPEWALVSIIEPSPHDPAAAYLAATRYKLDDFQPYLFKTADYGQSWTRITAGIPESHFTRAIREDPTRRGLLYAGTEMGPYVSFDDGASWLPLRGDPAAPGGQALPVVPIHDLVVKEPEGDLVVATHGRSFWILDDLSPLRQLGEQATASPARLVKPRPAIRFKSARGFGHKPTRGKNYRMPGAMMVTFRQTEHPLTGEQVDTYLDAGKNPPDGVIVSYDLQPPVPEGEVRLTFLEADGREIRSFSSRAPQDERPGAGEGAALPGEGAEGVGLARETTPTRAEQRKEPRVPKEAGLNRFVWNMRYPDATRVEDDASMEMLEGALAGPVVPPGSYQVRLTVGEQSWTEPFEVRADPRVAATPEELRAQFDLLLRVRDTLSAAHEAINRIRRSRRQIATWQERARDRSELRAVADAAAALEAKLGEVEGELIQVKATSRQDTLNFPIMLNGKLGGLGLSVASADAAPTRQALAAFDDLAARVDAQLERLRAVERTELEALNRLIREQQLPAIG